MHVNRKIFTAKPGTSQDVFELCQRILSRHPYPHPTRVYRNVIGHGNEIIVEFECESLSDYETIHPRWLAGWPEDLSADWRAFEIDGRDDFWQVVELKEAESL